MIKSVDLFTRAIAELVKDTDEYCKKTGGIFDIRDGGAAILNNRCIAIGLAYGCSPIQIGAILDAELHYRNFAPAELHKIHTFH